MPSQYSTAFDRQFIEQVTLYFGYHPHAWMGLTWDWRWFKAQALAESGLNAKAVSPAGAKGLMRLIPATSAEISRELGLPDNMFDPLFNIKFGIYHDLKMWRIFKRPVPQERLRFMFAAYNAGAGNIIKAQSLATDPHVWASVAEVLPRITGKRAQETINYIPRIERYFKELGGVLS